MKREIGRTCIEVYPIGLGAMPVSSAADQKKAVSIIHAALDAGMNFIDTCDIYCLDENGVSQAEALVRDALDERDASHFVAIAIKGGLKRQGAGGGDAPSFKPEQLRKACEQSLISLKTSSVFLYQLHVPLDRKAFEENLHEVARMKADGMILHVGLFNASLDQIEAAQKIVRVESVQNRCNPFQQKDLVNGVLKACEAQQISYLAYCPMGGAYGHQALSSEPLFQELAKKYDVSPYAMCLMWLLSKSESMIPIPGATRIDNVTENVLAPQLFIDPVDLARIDAVKQA